MKSLWRTSRHSISLKMQIASATGQVLVGACRQSRWTLKWACLCMPHNVHIFWPQPFCCAEICESRFCTLLKSYVYKYVAHTPEFVPHLVISLLFVSQKSCSDLSNGFVHFRIKLLLLAAHFLTCSYIYANLYAVPAQLWPCMFDLYFPVFLSLVMGS